MKASGKGCIAQAHLPSCSVEFHDAYDRKYFIKLGTKVSFVATSARLDATE